MARGPNAEYVFNVVLVGDSDVGKSNLLSRFARNEFSPQSRRTIGVEFAMKKVQIDGKTIQLKLWDTGSLAEFMALTNARHRNVLGALLIYDVLAAASFRSLDQWFDRIRANVGMDCSIVLVGNKADQGDRRAVPSEDAERFAKAKNIQYVETSALDSTNVEQAFLSLINDMCRVREAQRDQTKEGSNDATQTITLGSLPSTEPSSHRSSSFCYNSVS